jgi:hypothetical protein
LEGRDKSARWWRGGLAHDARVILVCVWPALYPTQEHIDKKREELGDIAFRREMLLQVVPEEGQDVLPEDVHYYDYQPFDDGNHLAYGVDLAISTKESAARVATTPPSWPPSAPSWLCRKVITAESAGSPLNVE